MKRKNRLIENWKSGAIGAAITVSLGLASLIFGKGLKHLSYDLPFALRPNIEVSEARIIYMDEASLGPLQQDADRPWNRDLHRRLLLTLTDLGARAVVFDVLLDTYWTNKLNDPTVGHVDAGLAQALQKSIVVLAAKKEVSGPADASVSSLITPIEPFRNAAPWGITQLPQESDGCIRRHSFDPHHAPLAWTAATLVSTNITGEQSTRRWINYYGRTGTIPSSSYHQVLLSESFPRSLIEGKVIFVGQGLITDKDGTDGDQYPTPYTRWGAGTSPGVEIQATAFLNLLRNDHLTELPPLSEFLLLLALGALLGYGASLVPPWIGLRYAAATVLLVGAAALHLVWKEHLWFPFLIPLTIQIPAALAWSALSNTRRLHHEKAHLERTLATARSALDSPPPAQPAPAGSLLGESISIESATAATPLPASTPVIPDLTLLRNIGRGAYGEVWLARDVIGTYKAVKIVHRNTFKNDAPFDREFRGIKKFTPISRSHPGFINILHVGRNDQAGYFYTVMELGDDEVNGQQIDPKTYTPKNLARELRRRGSLPVSECLDLSLALSEALGFLHQQKLIHRDIKPSNIIFVNNTPKFADIGLVTDLGPEGGDASYLGTEGFIAPEGPGTAAADVFSLGKVIYEASMGRDRGQFPELPTTLVERPDRRALLQLNDIILKACEVDVARRYQTAAELHAALLAAKK